MTASALQADRIILVGCVKTKQDRAAAAKDLYVSTLWRGRRSYAERTRQPWFILSACGVRKPGRRSKKSLISREIEFMHPTRQLGLDRALPRPVRSVPPHPTLAALPADGIAIVAWVARHPGNRSELPAGQPPFQLTDAQRGPFEGVPPDFATYQIGAYVRERFDVVLWVFFGRAHPTAAQLDRAQAELERLHFRVSAVGEPIRGPNVKKGVRPAADWGVFGSIAPEAQAFSFAADCEKISRYA
jgi:hypothetical protein